MDVRVFIAAVGFVLGAVLSGVGWYIMPTCQCNGKAEHLQCNCVCSVCSKSTLHYANMECVCQGSGKCMPNATIAITILYLGKIIAFLCLIALIIFIFCPGWSLPSLKAALTCTLMSSC